MNRTELLERLDGTEWVDFEVKSAQGGISRDAFKTLSAFANSGGGWLVFGVGETADGYEILGIADIDRFQNDLLSASRSPKRVASVGQAAVQAGWSSSPEETASWQRMHLRTRGMGESHSYRVMRKGHASMQ